MAGSVQRQKVYVQVTELCLLAKALRAASIPPESPAKARQINPRFTVQRRATNDSFFGRLDKDIHRRPALRRSSTGSPSAATSSKPAPTPTGWHTPKRYKPPAEITTYRPATTAFPLQRTHSVTQPAPKGGAEPNLTGWGPPTLTNSAASRSTCAAGTTAEGAEGAEGARCDSGAFR